MIIVFGILYFTKLEDQYNIWNVIFHVLQNVSARQRTHNDTYRTRIGVYPGVSGS